MEGQRLSNRYELLRELGRGGMGVVYLARDPLLEREVAVKLMPRTVTSPESEERFLREARVVAGMDHPSIVAVHDSGSHEGSLFFVMPLVRGTSLRTMIREGTLRLEETIEILVQVADALDYSHTRGVIHRDIKPENILVAREASGAVRVRITDFGLAMVYSEDRITRTGALVGTASYLSPEQVSGEEEDARSDVFSLGTVLYECLTGETPFSGTTQSILYRIVNEAPESPIARGATIPDELDDLVMWCLEKNRVKRPQRASDLAQSLEKVREGLRPEDRARLIQTGRAAPRHRRGDALPLIGRAKEMGEIHVALNQTLAGECHLLLVAGEAGVGKTRLLEEADKFAAARGVPVLHGRFVEMDRAFPYQAFCEAIQEYFRSRSGPGSSAPVDFSDLAADLAMIFPALSEIGEIRSSSAVLSLIQAPEPEGLPDRTSVFELLARSITRIAGGRPLMLLLENLHSAEASVEALHYMVHRLASTPILIVATYRPAEVPREHPLCVLLDDLHGDPHLKRVNLAPFTPDEHRALLGVMLGSSSLDRRLVERLYELTEGNPYFTVEILRSLAESGRVLQNESGVWTLSGGLTSLPPTIQQTVERRLEQLPDEQREMLALASVMGRSFEFEDLVLLSGLLEDVVQDAVGHLLRLGFLQEELGPRQDRLAFSSGIMRDVLYEAMPRRRRRTLHRKCAEQLERRHANRLDRFYPGLVHHFAQADVPEKVVEYGLKHTRSLLAAFSSEEAARAARTVLDFLDEESPEHAAVIGEARMMLAEALRREGNFDGALREMKSAFPRLDGDAHREARGRVCVLAAQTAWEGRRVEEAREWVERALEILRSVHDPENHRRALSLGATLANLRGDYERAAAYVAEAERLRATAAELVRPPAPGGCLRVGMTMPSRARHPADMQIDEEVEILANVFETLVRTDSRGNPAPNLAERWEMKDRGRIFVFHLRNGVRWSDGTALTAADVPASFEAALRRRPRSLAPAYAAIRGAIEFQRGDTPRVAGIVVVDDSTVEIHLGEPLPIYPAMLADPRAALAREQKVTGEESPADSIGTGPFRLGPSDERRVKLLRNPAWWRAGRPRLDSIEFSTGLGSDEIARGVRTGEIDVARNVQPQELDAILRDRRLHASMAETQKRDVYFTLFNPSTRWMSLQALRRAMRGVIRTQDVVLSTIGRFAEPAECLLPPGILGHDPGRRRRPMSVQEARALVHGVATGVRLRAAVHPILQTQFAGLRDALFRAWAEIGIDVEIVTSTMEEFLNRARASEDTDLLLGRYIADYGDPDNFSYHLFHSKAGIYRTYYSSPDLDELLERARAEGQNEERERLYRRIEGHLLDSDLVLPLFHDIDYRVAGASVRGLKLESAPPYVNYSEIGKVTEQEPGRAVSARSSVIRVPLTSVLQSIDPAQTIRLQEVEVSEAIFENLVREGEHAEIKPWLAETFRAEDGGRRYRFRLHDGIRFHDGRRLSARDVRASFERLLSNRASSSRWVLSPISGADRMLAGEARELSGFHISSDLEFTIDLAEPIVFFPALLAHYAVAILPEGMQEMGGTWKDGCVGTGPFRVSSVDLTSRIQLEANPYYWRHGFPKSDGVVFTCGMHPQAILEGFCSGLYDVVWDLLPEDVEALRRDPAFGGRYRESPSLSTYMLAFNVHHGPLSEPATRRRVLQAAGDVEDLVRRTMGRLAFPARTLLPPSLLGHEPLRRLPPHGGGDASAPPIDLRILAHSVYKSTCKQLTQELVRSMKNAGIQFSFLPANEDSDDVDPRDADAVLTRWIADYTDPDAFTYAWLHTQKGHRGLLCGTREIDAYIERARLETGHEIRRELYHEIEEQIARQALLLPLFHEQVLHFLRPELEGLEFTFSGPHIVYESLWLRR